MASNIHETTVGYYGDERSRNLLHQQRVGQQLKVLAPMGAMAECMPDACDARSTQSRALRQRARTPMGRVLRFALQSQHHSLDRRITALTRCARSRFVQKTIHAPFDETLTPPTDHLSRHLKSIGYSIVVRSLGACQNNARTRRQRLSRGATTRPRSQLLRLVRAQHQFRLRTPSSHRRSVCTGKRNETRYCCLFSGSGY